LLLALGEAAVPLLLGGVLRLDLLTPGEIGMALDLLGGAREVTLAACEVGALPVLVVERLLFLTACEVGLVLVLVVMQCHCRVSVSLGYSSDGSSVQRVPSSVTDYP
jgi:hypothetical protein